ncbi:MAG: hypothetical protein R2877_03570 [Bdellovibrionota bacterium]
MTKRFCQAKPSLHIAIEGNADSWNSHELLAEIYYSENNYNQALRLFKVVKDKNNKNAKRAIERDDLSQVEKL